jgi:hypothetical protein
MTPDDYDDLAYDQGDYKLPHYLDELFEAADAMHAAAHEPRTDEGDDR